MIQCELYREQAEFSKSGDQFIPFEGRGKYVISFPGTNNSVDVYYKRLDNIRLPHQFDVLPNELKEILKERNGYVLLTNIGLNYNTMAEYEEDIPKYFAWLEDLTKVPGKRIEVIWRETSAAHWSYTANGYFSGLIHANTSNELLSCAPHQEGAGDPRNEIVERVLSQSHKNTFKILHYIPFYFATKDIWNMHTDFPPYPGGHSDCVHYCYHPVLWQPIWKHVSDIAVRGLSYTKTYPPKISGASER